MEGRVRGGWQRRWTSKRVGMEVMEVQNRGWRSDERGATCYGRGSFIPGSRLPSSQTSPSPAPCHLPSASRLQPSILISPSLPVFAKLYDCFDGFLRRGNFCTVVLFPGSRLCPFRLGWPATILELVSTS